MAGTKEIRVKAAMVTGAGQHRVLQLSDLDHLMPKLYVHMIEIFELPAQANKEMIVDNLVKGLQRTLADYPLLTGELRAQHPTARTGTCTSWLTRHRFTHRHSALRQ